MTSNVNRELLNAVHRLANERLQAVAKAANEAANAKNAAERNAAEKKLNNTLKEAKPVVQAATAMNPNKPVNNTTQAAETSTTNKVAGLLASIAAGNFNNKFNAIAQNNRYNATRQGNINKAVNNRRQQITPAAAPGAAVAAAVSVNNLITNLQNANNVNKFLANRQNNISKIPNNKKQNFNNAVKRKRNALNLASVAPMTE